jgi:hypothetical protein
MNEEIKKTDNNSHIIGSSIVTSPVSAGVPTLPETGCNNQFSWLTSK